MSEKAAGELEQLNCHDGHTIKPHNAEFSPRNSPVQNSIKSKRPTAESTPS